MIADSKLQLLTQGGKWEGIQHLTKVFTNAFGEPLVRHNFHNQATCRLRPPRIPVLRSAAIAY